MSGSEHPPWSSLLLRLKGLILTVLPVLPLIVLAAPLVLVQRSLQRAERRVEHTIEVKLAIRETLESVIDAETGVRGFILTANRTFLEPYDRVVRQLPRQLSTLRTLVSDNPSQIQHFDRVAALVTPRLDVLSRLIAAASASAVPVSPPAVLISEGKAIMDTLRAELSVMEKAEDDLLIPRRAALQTAYGRMWVLICFGAVLGTVVGFAAQHLFTRGEDEVRRLNAQLEARVAQRSADLAAAKTALARREGELEASQRLLQSILDYSPLAVQVKDIHGRYVLVNREAARVLNAPPGGIVGKSARDVMPPRIADVVEAHDREVIVAAAPRQFEETMVRPDGARVYASTKFPLLDANGQVTGVCGMSQDITERKIVEDDLMMARLEAMRANRAKSAFMSQMSHELRTPLNAILGFAQLFEPETLTTEQNENVQQITSGGRHLLSLINEVLEITRIESGTLSISPEPVHVVDVVQRAVEMIRPLAAQRGIVVDVDVRQLASGDTAVQADRQRLKQVLINLLSNAVKYNRLEGRITVGFEERDERRMRITVTDTGPGIPPLKLKLLFQPFERIGADQTDVEGTGLGLALSRAICDAMDVTLGVESVVDHGSTFWVELGLADPDHDVRVAAISAMAPLPDAIAAVASGTILYVEDNLSNVRLMARVLARRPGLTLLHAADGPAALAMIPLRRPDLILLDLHLPKMSGEEVLQRLWTDPATRAIPVVILTADATPGLPARLAALGAAALLTKPLDLSHVLRLLDGLLNDRPEVHGDV